MKSLTKVKKMKTLCWARWTYGRMLGIALAAAGMGVTTGIAHAGLISMNVATLSSTGTEITTLGTTLAAWNVNSNTGSVTINGVTFSGTRPAAITDSGFAAAVTDNAATGSHYSGSMINLMNDMVGTSTGGLETVTVSGLALTKTYQVQLLHHHDDSATRNMRVRFESTTDTDTAVFNVGDAQGYITTILFTADATSQDFSVVAAGGSSRAILNAIAVTYVPEPGSFAMLLFGAAFLWFVRRSRQGNAAITSGAAW